MPLASKFTPTLLLLIGFAIFALIAQAFVPNLIWIALALIGALIVLVVIVAAIRNKTQDPYE